MCCVGEGKNGGKIAVLDDRPFIAAFHRDESRYSPLGYSSEDRGRDQEKNGEGDTFPSLRSKSRSYRVPFREDRTRGTCVLSAEEI